MAERRYSDEEIAAIFKTAAEGVPLPRQDETHQDGLALADLQSIGREVGISPDAVARAAVALDIRQDAPPRTVLGFPVGVARTVDLGRKMSDDEWERFVVQLREVFDASGAMRSDGSFRQWANGNLRVMLEPTDTGHRLRFRTVNAQATAYITGGIFALCIAGVLGVVGTLSGHLASAAPPMLVVGLTGLGMFATGAFRLPRWARLRGRQMEALAASVATPKTLPSGNS